MSVTISIDLQRDPLPPTSAELRGGLRIDVDGVVLTRFIDVEGNEIDYTGTWVLVDVSEFLETVLGLKKGAHDLYDRIVVDVGGVIDYFVIEPLSDREIRLAKQVASHGSISPSDRPDPEVALGYVVALDDLAREVVAAGRELLTFSEEVGLDSTDEELTKFTSRVNELESLVEEYEGIRFER